MACGDYCGVRECSDYGQAWRQGCGGWPCQWCNKRKRWLLILDIVRGRPNKLLTLTTRFVEGGDPVAEAARQAAAFKLLVKRIRYRWPGRLEGFFAVREATERGWPHLHVALRSRFLEWAWLTTQWQELTGSGGVDIREIHGVEGSAKYIAKYLGKEPQKFGSLKRYWQSPAYAIDPRPERPIMDPWAPPIQRSLGTLATHLRMWIAEGKGPRKASPDSIEWGAVPRQSGSGSGLLQGGPGEDATATKAPVLAWIGDTADQGSRGRLCSEGAVA